MPFQITNEVTGEHYTATRTLREARNYCQQRLLKASADQVQVLSDISAQNIRVIEARNAGNPNTIFNPGF